MNRAELELAITSETEIVKHGSVYVIGSQSILGSFSEKQLPAVITMSLEVDIAPLVDDETETRATLIDAELGEWSPFHERHGFYIQGVGRRTANLPAGWKERLVAVSPAGHPESIGLCLEPHDLCAAKLLANREKDLEFVYALLEAGLIDTPTLAARVNALDPTGVSGDRIDVARSWVAWAAQTHERL